MKNCIFLIATLLMSLQVSALELGATNNNESNHIYLGPAIKAAKTVKDNVKPVLRLSLGLGAFAVGDLQRPVPITLLHRGGAAVSLGLLVKDNIEIGCELEKSRGVLARDDDYFINVSGEERSCYIAVDVSLLNRNCNENCHVPGQSFLKFSYGHLETTIQDLGFTTYEISVIEEKGALWSGPDILTPKLFSEFGVKYYDADNSSLESQSPYELVGSHGSFRVGIGIGFL